MTERLAHVLVGVVAGAVFTIMLGLGPQAPEDEHYWPDSQTTCVAP